MRADRTRGLFVAVCIACAAEAATAGAQETVLQPADSARDRAQAEPAVPEELPAPVEPAAPYPPGPAVGTSAAAPAAASQAPPAVPAPTRSSESAESVPVEQESLRSYEARALVPRPPGMLREEERIGSYAQPRWTSNRRFPTTRVYVRPEGTFGLEWWLEYKQSLEDEDAARYRSQYELEMGLGHRLQLDLYLQTEQAGHQAPLELKAEKLELRWALADWGAIPLNPTLYAEFIRQHDAPPKVELKLLLGEELASRWHFGFNLVFEHELGDVQENEYAAVTGVSYSLVDEVFSLGAEVKFETVDVEGSRWTLRNWELLAGPSFAWSPVAPMHVLLVCLFGNETEGPAKTPLFVPTLVVGWEL